MSGVGNPFDLPGPEFLIVYAVVGGLLLVSLQVARVVAESGDPPRLDVSDPYAVAYLRGGRNEVLRLAAISLIDRRLLEFIEPDRLLAAPMSDGLVRRRIERTVLKEFDREREARRLFTDADLREAADDYRPALVRLGLLPDEATARARRRRLIGVLVILVAIALTKILLALGRGRTNVFFLVVETAVFGFVAIKIHNPWATERGRTLLADLRRLFARLKDRVTTLRPGGATAEVSLAAAVFGIGLLPVAVFPYARQLFPAAARSSGDGWTGGWTSACGSGCGGGSGGGGGCGGGCGGCSAGA